MFSLAYENTFSLFQLCSVCQAKLEDDFAVNNFSFTIKLLIFHYYTVAALIDKQRILFYFVF